MEPNGMYMILKRTWEGLVKVPGKVAGRFSTAGSESPKSLSSDCSSLITMGLFTSVPSEPLNIVMFKSYIPSTLAIHHLYVHI